MRLVGPKDLFRDVVRCRFSGGTLPLLSPFGAVSSIEEEFRLSVREGCGTFGEVGLMGTIFFEFVDGATDFAFVEIEGFG